MSADQLVGWLTGLGSLALAAAAFVRASRGVRIADERAATEADKAEVDLASEAIRVHKATMEALLAAQEVETTRQINAIRAQVEERDALLAERDQALIRALAHLDEVTATLVEFLAEINGHPVSDEWRARLTDLTALGG